MAVKRLRPVAQCIACAAVALASCTDHEDRIDVPSGQAGTAMDFAGAGGELAGAAGARAAAGAPAAMGGSALAGAPSAMAGQPSDAGAGGEGHSLGCERPPEDGPYSVELGFCDRLVMVTDRTRDVTLAFEKRVYADCRVKWLIERYSGERPDYLNELQRWNGSFWGCRDAPVDDFRLVHGTPQLSRGDLAILVEHYLVVALEELKLSDEEQCEMQVALERLAQPLVDDDSSEPSQAQCPPPGMGGAGGADSGGAGGAAGQSHSLGGAAGEGGAGAPG